MRSPFFLVEARNRRHQSATEIPEGSKGPKSADPGCSARSDNAEPASRVDIRLRDNFRSARDVGCDHDLPMFDIVWSRRHAGLAEPYNASNASSRHMQCDFGRAPIKSP